jgi:hypothetical protein
MSALSPLSGAKRKLGLGLSGQLLTQSGHPAMALTSGFAKIAYRREGALCREVVQVDGP